MNVLVPGFDAGEPVLRRGIGGAAQKGNDHHVAHGLAVGQIGVDPQSIARLEVGNFGGGQRLAVTFHVQVDFWSSQIEGRGIGAREANFPQTARLLKTDSERLSSETEPNFHQQKILPRAQPWMTGCFYFTGLGRGMDARSG